MKKIIAITIANTATLISLGSMAAGVIADEAKLLKKVGRLEAAKIHAANKAERIKKIRDEKIAYAIKKRAEMNVPLLVVYLANYYSPKSGGKITQSQISGSDNSNSRITRSVNIYINELMRNGYEGEAIFVTEFGYAVLDTRAYTEDVHNRIMNEILNRNEEQEEINKLLSNLCKITNDKDLALKIFGEHGRKGILRDLLGTINAAQEAAANQ